MARHGSYQGSQYKNSGAQIRASFKNGANVRLARTLFPLISWGKYDAFSAHRWVLRLIEANPTTPEEVVAALCNYSWMVEGALAEFETTPAKHRKYQAILDAFSAWKMLQVA
jgi:hypothetical protein